jgi:hypothetical protein
LRRGLRTRVGITRVPAKFLLEVAVAALAAAAAARGLMYVIGPHRPKIEAIPVIAVYGAVYFALATVMQLPELAALRRLLGLRGR